MSNIKLQEYDLNLPTPVHHGTVLARHANRAVGNLQKPKTEDELFQLYLDNHAQNDDVKREELFFWTAEISNASMDSYFTRMAKSSLANYAVDARENRGVMFQDSHSRNELGVGRSLWGELVETGTPPAKVKADEYFPVVYADFFAVRGLQLGKMSTNDFILGVQRGVIADVSIGFKEGEGFQYVCSICGLDMWDWDCRHVPGEVVTTIENPDDDPSQHRTREEIAFAWIENARLSEVSAVYDGATTNAMIVKATREHRAGRLQKDVRQFLESRYRFHIDEGRKLFTGTELVRQVAKEIFAGDTALAQQFESRLAAYDQVRATARENASDNNQKEKNTMPQENALTDHAPRVRQIATDLGLTVAADADILLVVGALRTEIETLRPQATELQGLRKSEIDEAVQMRIAAFGEKANEAGTRKMLEAANIDTIREFKTEWAGMRKNRLGGARKTEDGEARETDQELDGKGGNSEDAREQNKNDLPEVPKGRYIPPASFGNV